MSYYIKVVTQIDLIDIARIHVLSWQQTYAGLVPQDYLDHLSIPAHQKSWEKIFINSKTSHIYIAYDNDEVVGFISFGQARDEGKKGWGEIYAVYLLQQNWGRGIGYALFQKAKEIFLSQDIKQAYLWALDTNKQALQVYQKWGGAINYAKTKNDEICGQKVKEVLVTFRF